MPAQSATPPARRWRRQSPRIYRIASLQTRRLLFRVRRSWVGRTIGGWCAPIATRCRAGWIQLRRAVYGFWRDQRSSPPYTVTPTAATSGSVVKQSQVKAEPEPALQPLSQSLSQTNSTPSHAGATTAVAPTTPARTVAPAERSTSRFARFRTWTVTRIQSMDRESWAWTAATATGVIALLLMLFWQFANVESIPDEGQVAAAEDNDQTLEGRKSESPAPRVASTLPQREPPFREPPIEEQPSAPRFEVRSRGIRLIGRSPFDDPPAKTPPDIKTPISKFPPRKQTPIVETPGPAKSPFDDPPASAKPKAKVSIFDPPPKKTETPQVGSPFGTPPTFPPVANKPPVEKPKTKTVSQAGPVMKPQKNPESVTKKPFAKTPVAVTPKPGSSNPFGEPPAKKQPQPEPPVFGNPLPMSVVKTPPAFQPAPATGTPKIPTLEPTNPFSPGKPAKTESPKLPTFNTNSRPLVTAKSQPPAKQKPPETDRFSIELIRVGMSPPADREEQFLVTSLGGRNTSGTPGSTASGIAGNAADGWTVAETGSSRNTIVPIQHGVGMPATSTIPASASIATRWAVDAPRLRFEVLVSERASVGQSLPIRLRVTNTGTATATGVELLIDLPNTLAYHVGRKLVHRVGALKPGETRIARLTPKVVTAGPIDLPAVAIADGGLRSTAEKPVETAAMPANDYDSPPKNSRRPRPEKPAIRRASVECYDGQRIILIRR